RYRWSEIAGLRRATPKDHSAEPFGIELRDGTIVAIGEPSDIYRCHVLSGPITERIEAAHTAPAEKIRIAAKAIVDEDLRDVLDAIADDDDDRAEKALRAL